jgi:formate dehydrogenase subunit delta
VSGGTAERVVAMANQIARNMATQRHDAAAAAVADHIAKFWDPRMKALVFAHAEAGGAGLDTLAAEAVDLLRTAGAPPPQVRATTFGDTRSDAG